MLSALACRYFSRTRTHAQKMLQRIGPDPAQSHANGDRRALDEELDRRRGADRQDELTELGEEQRGDGAGDDAADATGQGRAAENDGGD